MRCQCPEHMPPAAGYVTCAVYALSTPMEDSCVSTLSRFTQQLTPATQSIAMAYVSAMPVNVPVVHVLPPSTVWKKAAQEVASVR